MKTIYHISTYALRLLIMAAIMTATLFPAEAQAALGKQARTPKGRTTIPPNDTVVIVCDWDKPPYEFLNNAGEPAGSNIDVARYIMGELKHPVRFIMKEWSNALKTFERGDADFIFANINRYKRQGYYASQIINFNKVCVAMPNDTTGIVSIQSLFKEGVLLKTGDYSAMYFLDVDSSLMANVDFMTPKVALTSLLAGDSKYFVWGEEPIKWKIKELGLTGIYINNVAIPTSEVHLIGRDKDLVYQFDDLYSRMKQDGRLEKMTNRWFHPEKVERQFSPKRLFIGFLTLLLLLAVIVLNRLAKNHVKRANRHMTELNDMMVKALKMGNFSLMEYDIANDRMKNLYGSILPNDTLTLEDFTNRIHVDQQEEFRQKMHLLLDGRERRFELDKRFNVGTQQAPHWLSIHGHAICELNSNGRPAYVFNVIHDVTHDMEEEKNKRDVVSKYQVLRRMPTLAYSFYDKDGMLISLNGNMKALCGYTDDLMSSKHFWESSCMFDLPSFRNACSRTDRTPQLFCQHMEYPELGIDKYIEVHISPLIDSCNNLLNYAISAIDISSDRRHNAERLKLDRQLRQMASSIDGLRTKLLYMLSNCDQYIFRSHIESESIVFYRSQEAPEFVYDFDTFLDHLLNDDERKHFHHLLTDTRSMQPDKVIGTLKEPVKGLEGMVFEVTFNPILDDNGRIIGHEGICSNITPLHEAIEKLDTTTELAKNSLAMKSGFMASMTHELRTPLNAIEGFTSVLEEFGETEERAEYVRIIKNSCDMLQRLINDILEASSFDVNPTTIVESEVDFAKAFDDICTLMEQRAAGSGLEFQKDAPYKNFVTTIDIGRVQQVITNFVTNALKFTEKGHIRVGYRYMQHGIHIYCEDTGLGIPKEKQQIIFSSFVKLDEFKQGTGMGLAICKSIAERCGGKIGVDSDGVGHGSTFWLWIPCERRL